MDLFPNHVLFLPIFCGSIDSSVYVDWFITFWSFEDAEVGMNQDVPKAE